MATLFARVGDGDSEPWPIVHAFNTLRHIFNLSELAVDTSVYFAPGFQACLSALGSSWWEVRNAATLCLTALCVRVFGFRNSEMSSSTTGERGRRAITASEFFHRFPPLHDYLLSVLKEAVDQMRLKEVKGLVNHREQHPGLFPVLIILSRLASQPVTLDSSKHLESDPLSPSSFIPLVQDCGLSSPFMAVRQLAARALSPLISSSCSLETVMRELGEKLINQNVPPRSQQGSAMQLRSLILFNLPRDQKATPAVKILLDTLKSCLARDHATVAPAVSSSIFQATSAALSHVEDIESLAGLLEAAEAACLSVLFDQSQMRGGAGGLGAQADWPLPMKSVMRKHAAALYTGEAMLCSCLLNKRTDLVEKRMRQCLLGSCYEVREAAAENLIQLLGLCNQTRMQPVAVEGDITCRGRLYDLVALISSSGSFNDLISSVEGIVWEALSEDQTSDVKGKLLECLSLLQPLCTPEHHSTDESKELKTISSLLKGARGFDSKAAAIRCYGMAVGREIKRHQASTSQDEKVWLNEASRELMQEIESSTGADQPESSRAAGRDALASSRLLLLPPARGCMGDTGPVSIRALLTVLKLMEDEDKDTRDLAADAAQEAMTLSQLDSSSTDSQQDFSDGLDSSSSFMTGSLYVEVVIRRTVVFLSSRLSNGGSHALSAIQGLVYDPRDPIPELLQEDSSVLVRRLFEHEDDNQHEEPLLIAQLVARELRKASSLVQESSVASDWLLSCLETVERVALVLERQGSLSSRGKWIGGLANHPSIFPFLFRLVLAFWASGAKCHSIQPRLDAALSRLLAIISAPQLRRLLVLTQGKLRIQAESEPGPRDDSDDDSALFLL